MGFLLRSVPLSCRKMKPGNSFGVCAALSCVIADCYLGQVLLVFDSIGDMGHPSI
jgi:hypothetical protein